MAKKSLDKSIRKRITGKAWIRLEISDNARLAFLRGLFLGGDTTIGVKRVVETLHKEYGIVAGVDEDRIARILEQVSREPNRTFSSKGDVIVAQAPSPVQMRDGEVEFHFLSEKLKRNPLPYEGLKSAFAQKDVASVSRAGVQVRAVAPGEKLATLTPHRAGKPGEDIFGRIVTPVSARLPRRAHLSAGDFVREEEGDFLSEIYGYVCVIDELISVVPPIWVAPDGSAAHFIHFPQADDVSVPQLVWLNETLAKMEILQEITPEALVQLHQFMDERKSGSGHFLLVDGVKPIPGEDAHVVLQFGLENDVFGPDGQVDVAARNAAYRVKKDDRIAEIVPPTLGVPGKNLKDEVIPARAGVMCQVKISERVRVEMADGQPRYFYAKIDGNASYSGNQLDVHSVMFISGDVNEQTGDIQADQDIEIAGSVRQGLKVTAGGNIVVVGQVDDGASLTAKGDVVVGQGILGKKAKVVALGQIQVGHIEDSTVVARKDVKVGDRIVNGQVRSGGRLVVEAEDGRIVGGEALCTKGIEAGCVMADASATGTRLGIAPDIETELRLKKLDESINFCNSNILKIFRTLNIQTLNAKLIEDILRRTPPGRKKVIAELLVKLKGLIVYRDESMGSHKALQAEIDKAFQEAEITVHKTAQADVQIKIGHRSLILKEDKEHVSFFLTEDGIQSRKADTT